MPEGDTLHQAASRLACLEGAIATRVTGSHRASLRRGSRLQGRRIESVSAVGKHLVVRFQDGWSLRTHLGMTGSWHTYRPGERWRSSPGKARVIIDTTSCVAVCFAAPTVQIGPDREIDEVLARLGPDLLHNEVVWDEVVHRARRSPAATIADLLLDQEVVAGIGNVYKSETLYLERIDPHLRPAELNDTTIIRCGQRAQRLLHANRDTPSRSTTGRRGPDAAMWVYGRAGRPCRRCRTPIEIDGLAANERYTYWCPSCQRSAPQESANSLSAGKG